MRRFAGHWHLAGCPGFAVRREIRNVGGAELFTRPKLYTEPAPSHISLKNNLHLDMFRFRATLGELIFQIFLCNWSFTNGACSKGWNAPKE